MTSKDDEARWLGRVAWLTGKGEGDCPWIETFEAGVPWEESSAAKRQRWISGLNEMGAAATAGRWGWIRLVQAEAGLT